MYHVRQSINVPCVLLAAVLTVGVEVSRPLGAHDLAVVPPEGDGAVLVPLNVEKSVGRPGKR